MPIKQPLIDNTDETEEIKAILAEYAKEKQNFAGDRPGGADDFEADEKKKPKWADDEQPDAYFRSDEAEEAEGAGRRRQGQDRPVAVAAHGRRAE